MNRKDKIIEIENTEGQGDVERLMALRAYENEKLHPTNVRLNEDKDSAFNNIKTAYNEGNLEAAAAIYESNKDILDDEYISEKVEKESGLGKFLINTGRMVASAIESFANNVYEVTDDWVRGLEKFGLRNAYFGVDNGEFKVYTQRPENAAIRPFEFVNNPDGILFNMGTGLIEFMIPFTSMLKATKAFKGGNAAVTALKFYGSGAVADFMFSPENGNFASLLVELGVQNEFVNWLDSRPENADDLEQKLKARGKQVLEGGIIGSVFDIAINSMRYMKQSPGWVAKAKSYLASNFEEPVAAGAASSKEVSEIPLSASSLDDTGVAVNTSPAEKSSVSVNEVPSQETALPVKGEMETTSLSKDLGNNNNLSVIDVTNKVYQGNNDINLNINQAKNTLPEAQKILEGYESGSVKVRVKDQEKITQKLKRKTAEPYRIGDYLGAKLLDNFGNVSKMEQYVEQNFVILEKDYKNKLRTTHYQVKMNEADNFTFEIQVRPSELDNIIEKHHIKYYEPYRDKVFLTVEEMNFIYRGEIKLEKDIVAKEKKSKKRYMVKEDLDLDTGDVYGISAEEIDNFNKGK